MRGAGGSVGTFVFTDIEGSTRLSQRLGPAFGGVMQAHDELLCRTLIEYGGSIENSTGDGVFASFTAAREALAACAAVQHAVASHPWPHGVQLRVRIGLHTGPASLAGQAPAGAAVNLAARICGAAHGGQVLVSDATC